jgi:hypothetical protein
MWTSCKLKDFKSKLGFSDMEIIDSNKVMFFEIDSVIFMLKLGYWNYDQVCIIIIIIICWSFVFFNIYGMFGVVKVAQCKLWCMLCVCDVYEFIN